MLGEFVKLDGKIDKVDFEGVKQNFFCISYASALNPYS